MNIFLREYNQEDEMLELISGFWKCHNDYEQKPEETLEDLRAWTAKGHRLYYIMYEEEYAGFVHLGSRGAEIDWLEDLFVLPQYQNKGIGTQAIQLAEEIVKEYSISLYIEAAARNERAIRLYRKLGYDCLNTITVRKDFQKEQLEKVRDETIYDLNFEIRKMK